MPDYNSFLLDLAEMQQEQDRLETIRTAATLNLYEKTVDQIEADFDIFLDELLKTRVREMHSIIKPLARGRRRTQIVGWLKKFIPIKDAEILIDKVDVEEREAEVFKLFELIEMSKQRKTRFIVKQFLRRGDLFLLVAAPKVGKSLFATSLALSVARGKDFLNRPTEQGNVLYIQNEEQLQTTTINRIHGHGLQLLELENPEEYQELIHSNRLLVSRNLDIIADMDMVLSLIKEKNISLVIIDSLGASISKSGYSEHNPEIVKYLYEWQKQSQNLDFTTVILHHATKMDSAKNKTEMTNGIAGVNGLVRANGGVIRLFPSEFNGDNSINLYTIPREGEPLKLKLSIQKDEACYWHYEVDKETSLTKEVVELQNEILRLLFERYEEWSAENPELAEDNNALVYGYTLPELMELTNESRKLIIDRLNDMKTSEAITCYAANKQFIYAIPPNGESWMKVYLEIEAEQNKKKVAEDEAREAYIHGIKGVAEMLREYLNNKDLEMFLSEWSNLSTQEKVDVKKELTDEDRNNLNMLRFPPQYQIGDKMIILENGNIGAITDIKYDNSAEVGYHKYYINNLIKPYVAEQIEKHEVDGASAA